MRLLPRRSKAPELQADVSFPTGLTLEQAFEEAFRHNGVLYPLLQQTLVGDRLNVAPDFLSVVRGVYKASPIAYACIDNRRSLFSQARFAYRRMRAGKPGDLFGTADLGVLEVPWPGGVTSDLLSLAEVWNSCSGNFFATRRPGGRIQPLRPDWTAVVLGSPDETDDREALASLDVEVVGYLHQPGGPALNAEPVFLLPEDVCHYMPVPDPEAPWRGMSWLTPVLEEVCADREMTEHKRKYLAKGATPNGAVILPVQTVEAFNKWVEKYEEGREGRFGNPYKMLFLAAGADVKPLGANLDAVDFRAVQGAGEVRIAVAGGVPPVIAGISEGLQGSALNAGNFDAAWAMFANQTIRPLWGSFCAKAANLVPVPSDAVLWYDDTDIPALAEDTKKRAEVQAEQASTINTLITAGFTPESAVAAVLADDYSLLSHTGLVSVQLAEPGVQPPPTTNGKTAPAAAKRALAKEKK